MKLPNNTNIYLTYAGSLPFILCTLFLFNGLQTLPYFGDTAKVLKVYGLVIASFMAGVHWGQYLAGRVEFPINLPIISNVIAIFVWASFLMFPIRWYLVSLILVFIILLLIDFFLWRRKQLSRFYFWSRVVVTITVLLSLVISSIMLE